MIIVTPGVLLLICLAVAFYSLPPQEQDDFVGGVFRLIGWLLARLVPPIALLLVVLAQHGPLLLVPLATLGWWVYLAVRRSRRLAAERDHFK